MPAPAANVAPITTAPTPSPDATPVTSLAAIRQQYPQYNDMTDDALADSLYNAHYSDMPRDQFNAAIGYTPSGTLTNIGKFLTTAAAKAGGALTDMVTHGPQAAIRNALFPDVANVESDWGDQTDTGAQSAEQDLKATGTEYQPTTPLGRVGLAGTTGLLAGAGLGPLAGGLSALSGAAGQSAAELGGDSRWQLAASLLPGLLVPGVGVAKSLMASPETKATRLFVGAINKDQSVGAPSLDKGVSDLANSGQAPLSYADVMGPNVKGLAEYVSNQPDQGGATATQFLNDRDKGAGTRLIQQTVNPLSSGKTAFNTVQELQEDRANAAAPLYQQAFAANKNIASPLLDRILQTPAGQDALAGARQRMQNKMTLMGVPDPELMQQAQEAGQYIPGGKGVASGLKLQTWDLIKQDLDQQIAQKQRAVATGNAKPSEVSDLVALKNGLVGELDRLDVTAQAGPNSTKPEGGAYAQARAAYSGPSQSINAVNLGSDIFNKSPELISQEIANLSPSDQDFYRLGAADALRKRIAQTSSGGNEALRIVGNDYVKQQFRPLFGSDDAYNQFIQAAENENKMFQTRQQMLGNSATYRRQAQAQAQGEGGGLLGNLGQAATAIIAHEPVAGLPAVSRAIRGIYGHLTGPNPEVNSALARMLFNSDAVSNAATADTLRAYQNRGVPIAPTYSPLLAPSLLNSQPSSGRLLGP